MSIVKITQADWDRVWIELAELRQSLNARPIAPTPGGGDCEFVATGYAPTPDYRSDLPADEPCSCEESERLKAELGEAQVRLQSAENEMRRLGYGVEDIVCFGSAGNPLCMSRVGDLSWDTVENKRATVQWINDRADVEKDLLAQIDQLKSRVSIEVRTCADWVLAKEAADKRLAAANALLEHMYRHHHLEGTVIGRRIQSHLANQPAAPADQGNYSLAELRRIYLAPQGELSADELVVLDSLLEFLPARSAAEQRVLDALRTVERGSLEYYADAFGTETGWGAVSAAELARRGNG